MLLLRVFSFYHELQELLEHLQSPLAKLLAVFAAEVAVYVAVVEAEELDVAVAELGELVDGEAVEMEQPQIWEHDVVLGVAELHLLHHEPFA